MNREKRKTEEIFFRVVVYSLRCKAFSLFILGYLRNVKHLIGIFFA